MTITISPEIAKALREIAARQGTTPEDVLTQTLEKTFLSPEPQQEMQEPTLAELFAGRTGLVDSRLLPKPSDASKQPKQTLADALAGHIGTQHSGRSDLSQNTGKAFTKLMVEKRKAGRL